MTSANGSPLVPKVQIWLERLTAEAFAPFGQLICARDDPPIFEAPHLRSWRQDFAIRGAAELMYVHYVAPADGVLGDRALLPAHPDLLPAGRRGVRHGGRGADRSGRLGELARARPAARFLRAWHGRADALAWHVARTDALSRRTRWGRLRLPDRSRHPARARATARVDGTPPGLTQEIDYRKRFGVAFEVVDPDGLLAASSVG
jgi:hypothetical protein